MRAKTKKHRPNRARQEMLLRKARTLIPGGVNSPVRAFRDVDRHPLLINGGRGALITDLQGKTYIDYVLGFGPMILGHSRPEIAKKTADALQNGTCFGAPTEIEIKMAETICRAIPTMEMVRMVNSGTEATLAAIRLARGYTKRDKILKFEGCYHGHGDSLLIKGGSGLATFGVPSSAGVPFDFARHTLVAPYNDLEAVRRIAKKQGRQIAAIIVEPVAGNMGVVPPQKGFLEGLRKLCTAYGIVLIFDEVITGFRLSYGGAQKYFGIKPDLTCLGKIIGGGVPCGAYGGRRKIMSQIAPTGPVYQAGTMAGNALAMAGGMAALQTLKRENPYGALRKKTNRLVKALLEEAEKNGVPLTINTAESMFTLFFSKKKVTNYKEAKSADTKKYARFFALMLDEGIYFPPSQFEACFLSTAHTDAMINKTISAARKAFRKL